MKTFYIMNDNPVWKKSHTAVMRRLLWCDTPAEICSVAVELVWVIRCHLREVLEDVLVRFISCEEKTARLWGSRVRFTSSTKHTRPHTVIRTPDAERRARTCATSEQKLREQQENAAGKEEMQTFAEARSTWCRWSIFIDRLHWSFSCT